MSPPDKVLPDFALAVIYAIAAISGGLGGCTAAAYYLTHSKHPRLPFIVAYVVLGIAFGVITLAGLTIYHGPPSSVEEIILITSLGGSLGAVALASANFTIKVVLKRLGIEVELTLRETRNGGRTIPEGEVRDESD